MKQAYVTPVMEVVEMNIETALMALSAANGGLDETFWGGNGSGMTADANGRRGSWGNLWDSGSSEVSNRRW